MEDNDDDEGREEGKDEEEAEGKDDEEEEGTLDWLLSERLMSPAGLAVVSAFFFPLPVMVDDNKPSVNWHRLRIKRSHAVSSRR